MREIAAGLRRFLDAGAPFALATTISVVGSSPRPAGAVMAVNGGGEVLGSLTGGCVEAAVYAACELAMSDGVARIETYGIADDDAYAAGLTCGGVVDVLIQPVGDALRARLDAIVVALSNNEPIALATVVGGPSALGASLVVDQAVATGSLGAAGLDGAVIDDARGLLAAGTSGTRHYGPRGERRLDNVAVFVQVFAPPARMLVFGAIDFAAAVARLGVFLGYHVTVCDARPVFATRRRFPDAHEVVVAWPHDYLATTRVDERTVITVLTHDPKFDVPLLERALRGPAAYIGAMGSRRTHDDRVARLRERGLGDTELARLHSPIGLDLGARTPEETAVSIAAEITRVRWGGTGRPLSDVGGEIHHAAASW